MSILEIFNSFPPVLATGWFIGISLGLTALSTGISVYGSMKAADAAEGAAAAEANEKRMQARKESETAAENARRAEQEKTRLLASQRASLAASGLSMEGTPLAVLGDTSTTLELDILDIGHQAAMQRRALMAGARVAEFEGAATASSLRTQAAADGVSGVASAASGYGSAKGYLS